jgi:hypothetical protein
MYQIVRALNIVLLKLAAEAPSGMVLGALMQVMFLCIPSSEVDHTNSCSPLALPISSTKPTYRLLLRVLGEELKRSEPFTAPLEPKVHMSVYIHVCMYIFISINVCIYMYEYICIYIYMYICVSSIHIYA